MTSNLLLLPSLLLSFEKKLSNKKVFKKPVINLVAAEEQEKNQNHDKDN
jgi:hypothetical protein